MKIRVYTKKDEKEVKKVITSVLKSIYGKTKLKWEDFNDYTKFYVAEEDKELIGTLALKKVDANILKLKRMYIATTHQRRGIGAKLLASAIKFARMNRFHKIILTTYPEMKGAVKFYQHRGFKIVKNPTSKFFTNPKLKGYNRRQIAMERSVK